MQSIILASQSPRRKQLLEWAEVSFEVIIQNTDESFDASLPATQIPINIAMAKALAVKEFTQTATTILAADTVVVLNNTIINKPKDRNDAIQILTALAGKKHQVITGVVLLSISKTISFSETTKVEFYPLTQSQIEFYVDEYKPYDKAGAYAIQEWIGVVGIKKITGDFYNVMGLPVSRVVQELQKL
jgi:septum formation protein